MTIQIEKIHHVAYRCKDAKETVEWYKKNLNMDFIRKRPLNTPYEFIL